MFWNLTKVLLLLAFLVPTMTTQRSTVVRNLACVPYRSGVSFTVPQTPGNEVVQYRAVVRSDIPKTCHGVYTISCSNCPDMKVGVTNPGSSIVGCPNSSAVGTFSSLVQSVTMIYDDPTKPKYLPQTQLLIVVEPANAVGYGAEEKITCVTKPYKSEAVRSCTYEMRKESPLRVLFRFKSPNIENGKVLRYVIAVFVRIPCRLRINLECDDCATHNLGVANEPTHIAKGCLRVVNGTYVSTATEMEHTVDIPTSHPINHISSKITPVNAYGWGNTADCHFIKPSTTSITSTTSTTSPPTPTPPSIPAPPGEIVAIAVGGIILAAGIIAIVLVCTRTLYHIRAEFERRTLYVLICKYPKSKTIKTRCAAAFDLDPRDISLEYKGHELRDGDAVPCCGLVIVAGLANSQLGRSSIRGVNNQSGNNSMKGVIRLKVKCGEDDPFNLNVNLAATIAEVKKKIGYRIQRDSSQFRLKLVGGGLLDESATVAGSGLRGN